MVPKDAELAAKTAAQYGARHTTFTLTLSEIAENMERMLASLDEPVANPTALSQYLLSQYVRRDGVVVVLGGDGGDELFLGYTRHRMLMAAYEFQRMPKTMQSVLGMLHPRIAKLRTPFGARMHAGIMANKEKDIVPVLKGVPHPYSAVIDFLDNRYKEMDGRSHPLESFMHIDRSTWLPDESLHRSDRSAMAHGLELRVPLIDLEVVSLADKIPVSQKLTPFTGKRILRDVYRSRLPGHLFSQPKRGWVSPGAKWLRDPKIFELVKAILSPAYYDGLGELYDWRSVQNLLTAHVEKRGYHLYPLWNLFALQVWARHHKITV
jgi:asparagine synthase (glutamine-hydrolysing)